MDFNPGLPEPEKEPPLIRVGDSKNKRKILKRTEIQLQDMEFKGTYHLESDSVYGAVIAIPQIARSVGWNWTMTALTLRCFLLLGLNYLLQGSAIMYIGEESQVMDVLAGKMHLCDFAYDLEDCPEDNHCTGPGGTKYVSDGLYSFDVWSLRMYMRDTVQAALKGTKYGEKLLAEDPKDPYKRNAIQKTFDPGEYGLESYWCRVLACLIFMINEVQDLFKTNALIMVLLTTPNHGESWVRCERGGDTRADPLGSSKFQIAGIPVIWKIVYFVVVVVPKGFLLYNVCWMGLRFLMESAGILDLVLGAMTMDFILQLDELLYSALGSAATKHLMDGLQSYEYDVTDNEDFLDNERSGGSKAKWGAIKLTIPRRLLFTILILVIFMARYYLTNCDWVDGMFVSKPMYLPESSFYDFENFVTGKVKSVKDHYWIMPGDGDL